jgi:DNA-directed RNA polymerase I, II, and III subunit RPABC5
MVLANKYRYYKEQVRMKKISENTSRGSKSINIDKVLYLTKEFQEKTPEGQVLDELNLMKMCCRRHFLTHVDIE